MREITISRGYALLFEMGCGKTLTSIAIMGAGYQKGFLRRVLVVAPTTVAPVWSQELDRFANFPVLSSVLLGTKDKRLGALDILTQAETDALKVAIINIEAVWREGILEALQAYNADIIIMDESQRIKGNKAKQSKAMHLLADGAPYRLALSGTPVQNGIIDLWSQYRFIDRTVFGTNFYTFRNRYCIMGGYGQHQIIGTRNVNELIELEYSVALRKTKEECLDLPDQFFINKPVTLSKKEMDLYNRLRIDGIAELESAETITAPTVLTAILRMQQVTGGFATTDQGEKPQQIGTSKLDALEDIIIDYVEGEGKKLVIFARFLTEVHAIAALCEKLGAGNWKAVCIYGDVEKGKRAEYIEQFQTSETVKVLIGQIDTIALGVTLTAADTCVYYSLTYNYGTYEQSLSRIHRIGQKRKCTYIHLIAEKTIDKKILNALSKKQDLSKTIVDNWRNILE